MGVEAESEVTGGGVKGEEKEKQICMWFGWWVYPEGGHDLMQSISCAI